MLSTTSMVLTPGWRWMASTMARVEYPFGVVPGGDLVVLDAVGDDGDILQAHRRTAAIGHDQRLEGIGVVQLAGGLDGKGLFGPLQIRRSAG